MDSDKAAVWVTNWDTERNGSSLTTRDGTSYLLANAFMLAYDYGQPHIFSGYCYAGVDDGAPGATRTSVPDMTCPTPATPVSLRLSARTYTSPIPTTPWHPRWWRTA